LLSERSFNQSCLDQLREHLKLQRYSAQATHRRLAVAGRFLTYLELGAVPIEKVETSHVDLYLQNELKLFHCRHKHAPSMAGWRRSHTAGIEMLLRLVHGKWPPVPQPSTPLEEFHRVLCSQYDEWMYDLRGLALVTRSTRCSEARRFLGWLGDRGTQQGLCAITLADIDGYMKGRAPLHRRSTVCQVATIMRNFLRYLYATRRTNTDLSASIIGPTLYAFERIPSILDFEDVKRVLQATRLDLSREGLRDYAILTLLSSYGLRAGEITALRLDDLDWRRDVLRIRHSKTGAHSELPLLSAVGDALLDYLKKGRTTSDARTIFIVHHAPYGPFRSGSSLYWLVRNRITAAGVKGQGRLGPHAFRHARAVSLLRAAVPTKEIGDILGHRSAESTAVYLKLATEDLRAVALEIPGGVNL
jgi:integrase/recombinase XerD